MARPVRNILVGLGSVLGVGLGIYLLSGYVDAAVTMTLLFVAMAVGVGLVLERIDRSRHRGSADGDPDEYWGFHGRPGS